MAACTYLTQNRDPVTAGSTWAFGRPDRTGPDGTGRECSAGGAHRGKLGDQERQRIVSWNNEVQRISDQMTLGDHDALREYCTGRCMPSQGSFR